MSRIIDNMRESMEALLGIGAITPEIMRAFNEICAPLQSDSDFSCRSALARDKPTKR
jgi:hypothetical protein